MRNGLAASLLLIAIVELTRSKKEKLLALLLIIAAAGIHKSSYLSGIIAIVSMLVLKDTKYAISFWLLCIPISLLFGGTIGELFSQLDFDSRTAYFEGVENS